MAQITVVEEGVVKKTDRLGKLLKGSPVFYKENVWILTEKPNSYGDDWQLVRLKDGYSIDVDLSEQVQEVVGTFTYKVK